VLLDVRVVAIPRSARVTKGPCSDCGNETEFDEYCSVCGHRRAEPDRDEADLDAITLITDRGIEHARNEDAAAAGLLVGNDTDRPEAIAVAVCDGVSSSTEAHIAAAAASKAGVNAMLAAFAATRKAHAAVLAGLEEATAAAATAASNPATAPSCTYTAAIVVPTPDGTAQITVGNVGDSRAYWFPETGPAQPLTVDDSLAQELITAGASAESEAVQRGAHTLTRWLGADSDSKPWSESSVQTIATVGRGSLLLCSDGLWNYLPDAGDIARFCSGTDAKAAGRALTDYALDAGGQDNITVIIVPIGGTS
jgi:serine/threonine protein phosphatase PrpC